MKRILTISALAIAMLIPSAAFTADAKKGKTHKKTTRKTATTKIRAGKAIVEDSKSNNDMLDEPHLTDYSLMAAEEEVRAVEAPMPESVEPKPVQSNSNEQIFKAVDQMPQFPGGQSALSYFLAGHIRYPQSAQENDIQGRVVVEFVVEKDGSISQATVVKSVDEALDREALRVVKSMPKWQPGWEDGNPVRCYYILPVNFRLQR